MTSEQPKRIFKTIQIVNYELEKVVMEKYCDLKQFVIPKKGFQYALFGFDLNEVEAFEDMYSEMFAHLEDADSLYDLESIEKLGAEIKNMSKEEVEEGNRVFIKINWNEKEI